MKVSLLWGSASRYTQCHLNVLHRQRRSRPLYDKLQDAAVAGQILDDNEKLLDNRILDRESVLKAIVFFEIIFCDNHRTYSFRLRILMDDRLL